MKKLIVIEGLDGTFKSTNIEKLKLWLQGHGYKVFNIHFPRYESPTGKDIKKYLDGDLGELDSGTVSLMYTYDRIATFNDAELKEKIDECDILLCDRYTTSTLIYQGTDLDTNNLYKFADEICTYEYTIHNIPTPDCVLYLYCSSPNLRFKALDSDGKLLDIHEKNKEFLNKVYDNAMLIGKKYNWDFIDVSYNGEYKDPDLMFDDITKVINNRIITYR